MVFECIKEKTTEKVCVIFDQHEFFVRKTNQNVGYMRKHLTAHQQLPDFITPTTIIVNKEA